MKEFMYYFQIDRLTIFEVEFLTYSTNPAPLFATEAMKFIRSKRDYGDSGQCQEEVLKEGIYARRFFDKWDRLHLHKLTPEEYLELSADIEKLKKRYNYIEDIRDCFGDSAGQKKKPVFSFGEIMELSKMKLKQPG